MTRCQRSLTRGIVLSVAVACIVAVAIVLSDAVAVVVAVAVVLNVAVAAAPFFLFSLFLSLFNLISLFAWIFLPKLRKTTKKVSRETSWDVPGRSRESPGDPRRLPGCPRRVPGSPLDLPTPALGPIWASF